MEDTTIRFKRGNNYSQHFEFTDENDAPVLLTGSQYFLFIVKQDYDDWRIAFAKKLKASDQVDNGYTINFKPRDTMHMPSGSYIYEITLITPSLNPDVQTVAEGKFVLEDTLMGRGRYVNY